MVGVSYGGISQLFVGRHNPPSLAAITPLSVIDNTATTLYPGGILNTGFALEWAEDRAEDAKPATADRRASPGRMTGSRTAIRAAPPTRRCTPPPPNLIEKVRTTASTGRRSPTR